MTRLWSIPKLIKVLVNQEGDPAVLFWRGRRDLVLDVGNHWRVEEDWWRKEIARDYYQIETRGGLLCVIYRDLVSGEWYMERVYD